MRILKLLALAAAAAAAMSVGAKAQDVGWDGFYAGVLGGVHNEGSAYGLSVSKVIGFNATSNAILFGAEAEGLVLLTWNGGPGDNQHLALRGRLGYLASQALLLYGTGGVVVWSSDPSNIQFELGGGLEYAFRDNVSARFDAQALNDSGTFYGVEARGGIFWLFD